MLGLLATHLGRPIEFDKDTKKVSVSSIPETYALSLRWFETRLILRGYVCGIDKPAPGFYTLWFQLKD